MKQSCSDLGSKYDQFPNNRIHFGRLYWWGCEFFTLQSYIFLAVLSFYIFVYIITTRFHFFNLPSSYSCFSSSFPCCLPLKVRDLFIMATQYEILYGAFQLANMAEKWPRSLLFQWHWPIHAKQKWNITFEFLCCTCFMHSSGWNQSNSLAMSKCQMLLSSLCEKQKNLTVSNECWEASKYQLFFFFFFLKRTCQFKLELFRIEVRILAILLNSKARLIKNRYVTYFCWYKIYIYF